jgi:predicted nucleotidyltransferase
MLTHAEITELVRRIVARTRPCRVIIFGSYAKGTATVNSDLDIFVVQETELPMARRADDLAPLLASMLIPVDVHIYTPQEVQEYGRDPFSFVHSVLHSGWPVFGDQLADTSHQARGRR